MEEPEEAKNDHCEKELELHEVESSGEMKVFSETKMGKRNLMIPCNYLKWSY